MNKEKFYKAWNYLENCKYFIVKAKGIIGVNCFINRGLNIEVVKINPKTNIIDIDFNKNTKVQFWLETGGWDVEDKCWTHDYKLDCSGDTFEDVIIELARLVKKYYN